MAACVVCHYSTESAQAHNPSERWISSARINLRRVSPSPSQRGTRISVHSAAQCTPAPSGFSPIDCVRRCVCEDSRCPRRCQRQRASGSASYTPLSQYTVQLPEFFERAAERQPSPRHRRSLSISSMFATIPPPPVAAPVVLSCQVIVVASQQQWVQLWTLGTIGAARALLVDQCRSMDVLFLLPNDSCF
jgi:hypothetical protein